MPLSPDALIVGRQFDLLLPDIQSRLQSKAIDLEFTYCLPTANPALRLDLTGRSHLGHIVLWASGACEVEVVRLADGVQVLGQSLKVDSSDEVLTLLSRVGATMAVAHP